MRIHILRSNHTTLHVVNERYPSDIEIQSPQYHMIHVNWFSSHNYIPQQKDKWTWILTVQWTEWTRKMRKFRRNVPPESSPFRPERRSSFMKSTILESSKPMKMSSYSFRPFTTLTCKNNITAMIKTRSWKSLCNSLDNQLTTTNVFLREASIPSLQKELSRII